MLGTFSDNCPQTVEDTQSQTVHLHVMCVQTAHNKSSLRLVGLDVPGHLESSNENIEKTLAESLWAGSEPYIQISIQPSLLFHINRKWREGGGVELKGI